MPRKKDAGSRRPPGSTNRAASARSKQPPQQLEAGGGDGDGDGDGDSDDNEAEDGFSPAPAPAPAAAKSPSMSWDQIREWDAPPDAPPPPPPPRAVAKRQRLPPVGPAADGCADPSCADPSCAPLQRRAGTGPRAADLPAEQARLQENVLGLAKDNKAAAIRALVAAHGLSAAYGNSIGQTALHVAAIWNATDAGAVLIELGADVNAKNDLTGAAPLHMAAMRGRREFCTLLLAHGADPTLPEDSGRVAAQMADDRTLAVFLMKATERWQGRQADVLADLPAPELSLSDSDDSDDDGREEADSDSDDDGGGDDDDDDDDDDDEDEEERRVHKVRLAEQLKEKGNAAFRAGSHAEAARLYSKALALDASNHLAYANRSNCWGKLHRWEDAVADARK